MPDPDDAAPGRPGRDEDAGAAERARSFGAVAEDYDRLRPPPVPAAVAWLLAGVPAADGDGGADAGAGGCGVGGLRVVDLAAGTGLLTRALLAAGVAPGHLTAVEPDERMRAVLARRSPGVRVLAGVAEDLPLAAASADVLLVSSAWHWVDPVRAVPEVARVLRDGGRFGALWTGLDPAVLAPAAPGRPGPSGRDRHRRVDLPEGAPFDGERTTAVSTRRLLAPEDVVALGATYSRAITATAAERERAAQATRAAVGARLDSEGRVPVTATSRCWRADRLPR